MSVKIHRSNKKIKEGIEEYQWDQKKLEEVIRLARHLKKSDLFIFWLQRAAKHSEEFFDDWLNDISKFSKNELIDIIHELGPKGGEEFIKKFKK